ncbi:glycosyltransferase [Paenibacillus aurantiacus]|uniref:Glycosyltransferase n=1 Tax=Paenibacillus aurantiacus TaxID=1936118 RepID=A0ABV5L0I7_9BACL
MAFREVSLNKKGNLFVNYWTVVKKLSGLLFKTKVVYIPALNQGSAPISILLSKLMGRKVITDMLISSFDTVTDDRKIAKKRSLRALKAYVADYVCVKLSDKIICDTEKHKEYFVEHYKCGEDKVLVIPVGSEDIFKPIPVKRYREDSFNVLFYGGFSPMHGIDKILMAAKELDGKENVHFVLVGGGQTKDEMLQLADRLRLTNVEFIDFVPYEQLPAFINSFDAGLGIFGETGKAFRVVPNKVYQMASCGKAIITLDTPGIREVFSDDRDIVLVPTQENNAQGIAKQIMRLKQDMAATNSIGDAAYALMEQRLSHPYLQACFEQAVAGLEGGRR